MTDTVYYPYLGSGKIYARVAGASAGLMYIGNASKLELAVAEDKQKAQRLQQARRRHLCHCEPRQRSHAEHDPGRPQ